MIRLYLFVEGSTEQLGARSDPDSEGVPLATDLAPDSNGTGLP